MPYGQQHVESEDEARSDFKTTTLRFTNNNFIVDDPRKKTTQLENTTGGFQFGSGEFHKKRDESSNSRVPMAIHQPTSG